MTEVMENTLQGGAVGQPPNSTSPQSVPPSANDVTALAAALKPIIAEEVKRQTQSVKDKRIAQLQGDVNGFTEQLAEFQKWKALNKSDDEALFFMQMQQSLRQQGPVETQAGAAPQTAEPNVDTRTILLATQLDENDPQVSELVRRNAGMADYVALAARRRSQPAPNAAAVMPTGSGQSVPSDELPAQYKREVEQPGLTVEQKRQIRVKYRALGLPI